MSDDFEPKIDLHGHRIEEGLAILDRFLDRAMLSGENEVSVIHGHGSGQLKQAVRSFLTQSPYVEAFHPGDSWEGGDAVTIVRIKK